MIDPSEIVHCEVCRLPHGPEATRCEDCEHQLGTPPDWKALERQLPDLRLKSCVGAAVVLGMLGVNYLLFGGAGYIVLLAPLYWTVIKARRYRALSRRIALARNTSP